MFSSPSLSFVAARRRVVRAVASMILPGALLVSGCFDDGKKETAALNEKIGELEEELQRVKDQAQLDTDALLAKAKDLETRVQSAETQSTDAAQQVTNSLLNQSSRFERLEKGLADMARRQEEAETMAILNVDFDGHTTMRTEHGTFLVRLEEAAPNAAGYRLRLNIGNPMGITIQEFTLRGDFGQTAPKLDKGETYEAFSVRADAWEKSLTPFQTTVLEDLKPNQWTDFDIHVRAKTRKDLEFIRMQMDIRRAYLYQEVSEGSETSYIGIDNEGASAVQTKYGTFMVMVDGSTATSTGQVLHLQLGNPLGIVINEFRVQGHYGSLPPNKSETETPEAHGMKLQEWEHSLKPFDSPVFTPLKPFQWTKVDVVTPAKSREDLAFIRFTIDVQNVSLMRPASP